MLHTEYTRKDMKIYVGDIEIHFEKKGQGHPLIMLHGNGEDLTIFNELSESLKDQFTIYLIDSRNHGKSSKTNDYAYEIMAFDLVQFMGKLRIEDPYLFGFSDGGIICLLLSMAFPNLVSKMAIAGANLTPKGFRAKDLQEMKRHYEKTLDPLYHMMLTQPHIRHQDLHKITAKTLIIAGENDSITKKHTQSIKDHIKHSELRIIPSKSHEDYIIHSDVLKEILLTFFT